MKLFLFLLLVLPLSSLAQSSIIGNVVNNNGRPIPFSTVKILKKNKDSILASTTTDNSGAFKFIFKDNIALDSAAYIYASYLKNTTDTISLRKNQSNVKLIIPDTVYDLSEVRINSTASSVMLRKADRFIFIPSKTLTEGSSALDMLKITPLIQYDNKNDIFSIINKEGTVVYLNNKKSLMPKEMIISQLRSSSADNIINIEIITNPGSEYPGNTSGGVININLKRMTDEGWSGNLTASSEQAAYNTTVFNGSLNYRKGKIGVRVSPFINNSFNYNSSTNLVEASQNKFENTERSMHRRYLVLGGGISLDYDINSRNLLSFNGFASTVNGKSKHKNYTEYYSKTLPTDSIYSSPVEGKDNYLYNFGNIYYQYKIDSLNKKFLTLNLDYNQFNQENTNLGGFQKILPDPITNRKYQNILPQSFFNISEGIDYSSQINSRTKINIGGQVSNTRVTNDLNYNNFNPLSGSYELDLSLSNKYKYLENYIALYLSYNKTFNDKWVGVFGLRGEYTNYSTENRTLNKKLDTNYVTLFPNISLSYAVSKKNNLSFSFAKKIKRPSIELLFPGRTYYNPNYFSENNPFLQPAITYNLDAMYAVNYKYYFSSGYSLATDQYARFIIPYNNDGIEQQERTYLNYGDQRNFYLSFFTLQKLFKGILEMNFSSTVNFSRYKIKTAKNQLQDRTINNVNYNFLLNNTYYISSKKKWFAYSTIKYYSPLEDIATSRKNILFSTDLGLSKTLNNISFSLYLTDIFNTYGRTEISYHSNAAYLHNQINQNNYNRSISLNVRYFFGNNKLNGIKNKNSANEDLKKRIN